MISVLSTHTATVFSFPPATTDYWVGPPVIMQGGVRKHQISDNDPPPICTRWSDGCSPPSRFHAHDNNVWGGNPYIQIHLHCCNWESRPRFKPPSRDWLEVCRWVSLCRWPYSCWSPHHIVVAGGGRPSRGVYKTVQSRVHEQCISGGFSCIEPSSIL